MRLMKYILNESSHKDGFIITHNLLGDTKEEWNKQFLENESKRLFKRKSVNIITHEIISFNKLDHSKITDDMLKDIARAYIKYRGNGQFVIVPHRNTESTHLHMAVSGLEIESGMSLRMSKKEFEKFKKEMEIFQRNHYDLEHSFVEHGKGLANELTDREAQLNIRKGKLSRKQILKNILT